MCPTTTHPPSLSRNESKLLTSLIRRKERTDKGLYRAEGSKVILPLLRFYTPYLIITTAEALDKVPSGVSASCLRVVTHDVLCKHSLLESPPDMIAILRKETSTPQDIHSILDPNHLPSGTYLVALDTIQNPGNLGTIIRLCDWLGIRHLLLGIGCVDLYNPKVVQATAGALGALQIAEQVDLQALLRSTTLPIIATSLTGVDVSDISSLGYDRGIVLLGNEGHGIQPDLIELSTARIRIPPATTTVSESLNVSICGAILLSHLIPLQSKNGTEHPTPQVTQQK